METTFIISFARLLLFQETTPVFFRLMPPSLVPSVKVPTSAYSDPFQYSTVRTVEATAFGTAILI